VFGTHIGEIVEAASATSGASASRLAAVGVDMPLHLSDDGHRSCDLEARRHLGAKRSSLFVTPPRAALTAATYEEACAVARRAWSSTGGGSMPRAPCTRCIPRCRSRS
jgi:predicted RNase H-like nuclease